MRKIPEKLKQEMASDPFYETCCLSYLGGCIGRIEWHHNLIFAGKQINEKFTILPLCTYHHNVEKRFDIKPKLNQLMVDRATEEELEKYSKVIDWKKYKKAP